MCNRVCRRKYSSISAQNQLSPSLRSEYFDKHVLSYASISIGILVTVEDTTLFLSAPGDQWRKYIFIAVVVNGGAESQPECSSSSSRELLMPAVVVKMAPTENKRRVLSSCFVCSQSLSSCVVQDPGVSAE